MIFPNKNGSDRAPGFTLLELLVCITIVTLLAATAIPVFQSGLSKAKNTRCLANLSKVSKAIIDYSADNSLRLPPLFAGSNTYQRPIWINEILPYGIDGPPMKANVAFPATFYCPASTNHHGWADYGVNANLFPYYQVNERVSLVMITNQASTIMVSDAKDLGGADGSWYLDGMGMQWNSANAVKCIPTRHGATFNAAFVDGHIESIPLKSVIPNIPKYFGSQYRSSQ